MKRKSNIVGISSFLLVLLFSSCEEKVETPSPDFYFEITDPNEGIVVMQEPYQVKVDENFSVVADNNADFNSFWPGDTVFSIDTTIRVFAESRTINHQGISIGDDGIGKYAYSKAGTYEFTFVSVNLNAGATIMETATATGTIKVVE